MPDSMRTKRIRWGDKSSRRGETSDNSSGREENSGDDVVDRISKLPEPIISLILSFLPTKTSVTTSVLSTRWRYLWTTAFNLDFQLSDSGDSQDKERGIEFVKYVNWVLLHQKAGYIDKFSLVWLSEFTIPSSVHAWLSTAIFRYVQELRVVVGKDGDAPPIQMPIRNIFRSEKLLSLELNGNIYISSGISIALPRVERLKLVSIQFENPKAFQQLITGCPLLKYLDLDLKAPGTAFEYTVSSTSLIHFTFCLGISYDQNDLRSTPHNLVLEVPSLEVLMLDGMVYWITIRGTLRSLVKAYLRQEPYWDYSHWDANYCNLLVLAIRSLNSAHTLFLSAHLVWALTSATIGLCTKFDRLMELDMELPLHRYYVWVVDFVQCSDNLQILRVMRAYFEEFESLPNLPSWRKPEDIPICLSKSLKTVNLYDYISSEEGYEMVNYILQNGGVMEKMEIDVAAPDAQVRVIRDICELPRKSPTCKVKFSLW